MGQSLLGGPLGALPVSHGPGRSGLGPYGPPWALMGRALWAVPVWALLGPCKPDLLGRALTCWHLMGPCALVGQILMGRTPMGFALMGRALMGRALMGWALMGWAFVGWALMAPRQTLFLFPLVQSK